MTATTPRPGLHDKDDVVLVPFAKEHLEGALRLSQEMSWPYRPRTITLNATAEGLALYEKRGFLRIGVIQQHQGVPDERRPAPPASLAGAMGAADVEAFARLDRQAPGWARRRMLDRLIQAGDCHVLVREGEPRGCAISRLFGRGHVIGPVVAESAADARASIEGALARLAQVFVRVDTTATSKLGDWLESIGLRKVGDASTTVLVNQVPSTAPARMFALANQSFN